MDPSDRILVIVDGTLCSLVGLALAAQTGKPVAWIPPVGTDTGGGPVGTTHLAAVRMQVDRLGIEEIVFPPDETGRASELGEGSLGSNTTVSLALVRAAHDAFHLRCRSILWPVCCNASLDDLFRMTEIAALVSRIVGLDQPGSLKDVDTAIRTPFADMSRDQVADLAYDMDVPIECCWAMQADGDTLPSAAREVQHAWQNAILLAAKMRGWEASVQLPGDNSRTPARAYV